MRRLAALLLFCAGFSACLPRMALQQPTSPDHGAILMAVSFKGEQFPYWLRNHASELFFQRVQDDGSLEPTLVPANFRVGDRLYALDLTPGKYALVAASYFTGRTRQLARFTGDAAKQWVVEVKPGEVDFGGRVQLGRRFDGWDAAALDGLKRFASYLPPFKRAVIRVDLGAVKTDLSRDAEVRELRLARVDLGTTAWGDAAQAALVRYGNPPPVITKGHLWRKKDVPPLRAAAFSWQDTLRWGPPRKVTGGLEWRRPKLPVWVSVEFVPSQGAGARSLDDELERLREAGAPEDRHSLVEVPISSRTAYAAIYTTYLYKESALVGSDVSVLKTEALVVPAKDGFYKLVYRAADRDFLRYRPEFVRFARYLDLTPPPPPEAKT